MESAHRPGLTWLPGKVVGQHTLLREIARGGMAEIWLAFHRGPAGFERLVVIKRILADAEENADFVSMFLDEARIAAQLHHPNIVQVFDLGELEGSYFMVMEYLPGQSLGRVARRFLQTDGQVPPALAVEIISEAARGLGHAHRRRGLDGTPMRVVHRDVSPQNLFVTYDGQVKVLDFGIAKATGRLTKTATGVVRGKIAYMSPEQALEEPVGAATDVWALGVMLFELLTGTRMYEGADDLTILKRLAADKPLTRVKELRAKVGAPLEAIVARAVALKPKERFPDGQALHEALELWRSANLRGPQTLEAAMKQKFAAEVDQLPELYRSAQEAAAATPASQPSLPNRVGTAGGSGRGALPLVVGAVALVLATAAGTYALATHNSTQIPTPDVGAPRASEDVAPPAAVDAPVVAAATAAPDAAEDEAPDAATVPAEPTALAPADAGAAPTAPANVAPERGLLTLDTEPWTRVYLGKTLLGDTPLVDVRVPAGRQRLRLVNPSEQVDTEIEVQVPAGGRVRKKLAL